MTIEPSVEGQVTWTNNANYENGSERESDFVFEVIPRVSFLREGPRLRVNGSAALNLVGYAEGTQSNRILPQANVLANYEAIERFFYLEGELLANQQALNPFLPRSDTSSTFNKYTYVQGRIAPYLQGNIDVDWRYLVRSDNTYTSSTQADAPLDDAYYGRHVAEILRLPTPLGGAVRVQSDITRFRDQPETNQRLDLARATVNYAITPQFVAGLRGGYERTNYTFDEESGAIYGAELTWTPTPRTRLNSYWESRFFGPAYEVDFSHRQRTLAANFAVSRFVTTYPQLLLQLPPTNGFGNVSNLLNAILLARFPDPIERARQVQELINRNALPASLPGGVRIFSQSVNVVTSASATLAWIGVRNSVALSPYYLKTRLLPDAAIPPTFVTFNDSTQRGISLSGSHRLTPVMLIAATAARRESRGSGQAVGNDTDQNSIEAQLTRQLSPNANAFVGARYQQWDSTSATLG
ncbi:MAG: TIGR03016 family PEP-CTERM system-associated outer membrane protein, partial [Burkholderiaceae bacterium]